MGDLGWAVRPDEARQMVMQLNEMIAYEIRLSEARAAGDALGVEVIGLMVQALRSDLEQKVAAARLGAS